VERVTAPRASGVRLPYPAVPERVRAWVSTALGSPITSWSDQTGGMSPGCATRVVAEDGSRVFVKAVGAALNPDSPSLFRREIEALSLIGDDPLWASCLGSYDDGEWVGVLLEDVEGHHADLGDDAQMTALLDATDRLGERLARVPAPTPLASSFAGDGFIDVAAVFGRWVATVDLLPDLQPELVPEVVRRKAATCRTLAHRLLDPWPTRLAHWDIRNDNLLVRPDGTVVFVDWGAAGVGPAWVDPLMARLERVDSPWFDASVASSPALAEAGDDAVTGWLIGFGCHLAWRSIDAVDVGLPTLNEFRRTEARRILAGAARRLTS
jgi:Phosphotransferase enzyme family